ncbi:MAG: MFS transporter [Actinomycetota bacterium]
MFRSLSGYNYRVWASGSLVSNVGTWMQRTAQDWIVLTQLTDHDAAAVGITMALQFGPMLVFLPVSGLVADRFNQQTILKLTQASMGVLSLALALLTVGGVLQLWEVYLLAFLLGSVQAFDTPARQIFVSQLVGGPNLSNAVSLNSASFNLARTIGPAAAGMLIAIIGSGWVFMINTVSFAAVVGSLFLLKRSELVTAPRAQARKGNLLGGIRYVRTRPDIAMLLIVMFVFGTFGVNFPIYISTMATVVFHSGATGFGILTSIMAAGSVVGALVTASRQHPRLRYLFTSTAVFAAGCSLAAFAPAYWPFAGALAIMGVASQTITTTANSYIQLSTPSAVRGRVMAIYFAVFAGSTPIGAPIVGWVANEFGPRWSLGVGAASGVLCAIVMLAWMLRYRSVKVRFVDRHLALSFGPAQRELAAQQIVAGEVTAAKG